MAPSTEVWVSALIRRAQLAGAFAVVVRKGDARAGSVLVKVWNPRERQAQLYSAALDQEGEQVWIEPVDSGAEDDLDAYAERAARRDPDLWLVEIEDVQGRHFLTEKVG